MAKLSYGSFYVSSPAATTLSAATPAKAAGTTTALELGDFTHANNKLTYNQATTRDFVVVANVLLQKASGSASVVELHLYKNGSPVTGMSTYKNQAQEVVLDEDGNAFFDDTPFFLMIQGTVELANGDYLELYLETDTGDDVTVLNGGMAVKVAG